MTSKKQAAEDPSKDVEIQAIVFADSFQTKFLPLSFDLPKVLFPIANTPMIEYTIRFLRDNQIKEIFIFTAQNKKMIEDYFKRASVQGTRIKVISGEQCKSVGEALREIHNQGVIHNDFLLIFGDIVANFDISQALREHLKRRKEDKMNIITKIFKKIPINSPLRTKYDDCAVVTDGSTNQILQYQNMTSDNYLNFNLERINFKKQRNNIQVHYDWTDSDIAICAQEVFNLLAEHFDFNDFRDDFINGVLTSEIIDDKIFAYVLQDHEYFAKILDYRSYGIVTQQVLYRWLYPILPSTHDLKLKEKNNLTYSDFNTYLDEKLEISYTAKISNGSVIGTKTIIKDKVMIERSTLGKNCKIGKNTVIKNSIIWDNVEIGENCEIVSCVIADGVKLENNCKIKPGSVLGSNVHLREGAILKENSLVTVREAHEAQNDPIFMKGGFLQDDTFKLEKDEYFGSKTEYFEKTKAYYESDEEEEEGDIEADFKKDTQELLQASIENNVEPETVSMELNGLRLSYHATFSECIANCMPILFSEIKKKGIGSIAEIVKNMQKVLEHWTPLIKSITKNTSDELCLIKEIEKFCTEEEAFAGSFHLFLQILTSESILDWAAEVEKSESENLKKFYKLADKLIEFLKQSQEEDEEEEEEGENDDDS